VIERRALHHVSKLLGVGCSQEKMRELLDVAEESRNLGLTVLPSASSMSAREWTPKAFPDSVEF
jgi:hypothetical protein